MNEQSGRPSASAVDMVEAIHKDQKRVMPCAVFCDGEYGLRNVVVGVPVKIGKGGAEQIMVYDLTPDEQKALEYSWGGGDMRWELEPLGDGARVGGGICTLAPSKTVPDAEPGTARRSEGSHRRPSATGTTPTRSNAGAITRRGSTPCWPGAARSWA